MFLMTFVAMKITFSNVYFLSKLDKKNETKRDEKKIIERREHSFLRVLKKYHAVNGTTGTFVLLTEVCCSFDHNVIIKKSCIVWAYL